MVNLDFFGSTLVIAPHGDDEVLGPGGTIARLSDLGHEVCVAVVTKGTLPYFDAEAIDRIQAEAKQVHEFLGVRKTYWLDQPAAQLSETPHSSINAAIGEVLREMSPQTLLIPFLGDIHLDHQLTFLSSMVAARPNRSNYPRLILAYETLSETNWNAPYLTPNFVPNVFIEIEQWLPRKLEAMKMYGSQLHEHPHERSLEAVRALALLRGAAIHRPAAEAFVLVRLVA